MKLKFIPIDYQYFDYNGKNYAKIYGRNDNGKKVCIIDSIPVYIWAILKKGLSDKKIKKLVEKINKISIKNNLRKTKVLRTEVHNKKFLGKNVKAIKIFITNLKDGHAIADKLGFSEIDKRREYDLNYTTKYIIEKELVPLRWYDIEGEILNKSNEFGGIDNELDVDFVIKIKDLKQSKNQDAKFNPKILGYDIEVDELEIGKGEILMISLAADNFKKVLTCKKTKSKQNFVESFTNESEMLEAFAKYVKEYAPDILAGYFSDKFDLPYIMARANKNRINLNIGTNNTRPKLSGGKIKTGKIDGIVHLDLHRFIEVNYSQYLQSETLSLNEVSSELLGEKKVDFGIKHSSKLSEKEWSNYFKYNLQDSLLAFKLTKKLWPDLIEFSRIMQKPLFEVTRDGMSTHVEDYIIHNLNKFNEIIEKRPVHEEIGKRRTRGRYEGGFVFEPTPGLYEDIVVFDFTSFWPSIISTFNLSRSTLLDKKTKDSHKIIIDKKKFYFSKKPGFFPLMLNDIILKRKKFKEEWKKDKNNLTKARSNAYKLLANASYGYQGFFGARYYCPEASASTTSISRDLIKDTIKRAEEAGFKAIYSDTDSIMLLLNKKNMNQTKKFLFDINKNLHGIMELDLEDFYKRGIWVTTRAGTIGAKKKYALIDKKGKFKIRGFETVRRDWCNLARKLQNEILHKILEEGNEKSALEYTKEIITKLKQRKINKKDIIIRTKLKKPISEYKSRGPHVVAAKLMLEQKTPVSQGNIIFYFVSQPKLDSKGKSKSKKISDRVALPNEDKDYDIDYYLNNQVLPAVENIFQVFNINTTEVILGEEQKKLFIT